MPELVGVDHRADGLDLPVEDVERERVDDLAVPIAEDRTRLTVHLVRLHDQGELELSSDPPIAVQVDGEYIGERAGARLVAVPSALTVVA